MFGHYMGHYLVKKGRITQSSLDKIKKYQKSNPTKLGNIAVAEKLLTEKQADEINELQKKSDQRFGDIAVAKGYLLTEEVNYLLGKQGNPFINFVQAMTDNSVMTIEDIEQQLEEFQNDGNYSIDDMDALKSGNIDRIIPLFMDPYVPFASECISLAVRNIIRFINSEIILNHFYKTNEYSFGNLAFQHLDGNHSLFVGLASKGEELLSVAEAFAKEKLNVLDEDSFDAVCEFINCNNGLYASNLSEEDIHIDMLPPLFDSNKKLVSNGDVFVLPILINGGMVDLIVAVDCPVSIE